METLIKKNNKLLERPYDKIMKKIKENSENVDHNVIISVKVLEELMIDCYVMKPCSECGKLNSTVIKVREVYIICYYLIENLFR